MDNAKLMMTDSDEELALDGEEKKTEDLAGKDIESSGEDSEDAAQGGLFVNPLAAKASKKKEGESSEEWSDDESD